MTMEPMSLRAYARHRGVSLRAVQKAMLMNPARQHPYYWAAFIPIGNWTPLTKE